MIYYYDLGRREGHLIEEYDGNQIGIKTGSTKEEYLMYPKYTPTYSLATYRGMKLADNQVEVGINILSFPTKEDRDGWIKLSLESGIIVEREEKEISDRLMEIAPLIAEEQVKIHSKEWTTEDRFKPMRKTSPRVKR